MGNPPTQPPAPTTELAIEQPPIQQSPTLAETGVGLAEQAALLQIQAEGPQSEQLGRVQFELVNVDNPNRFSLAQRRLESSAGWTGETRLLAVEINRADQELRGEGRLTFEDAKAKIQDLATNDMASDDNETKQNGRGLDSALRGLSRPDIATQERSLEAMLADIEQTLAGYEQSDVSRSPEFEAEVKEYRAIRDALVMRHVELTAINDRMTGERAADAASIPRITEARAAIESAHTSADKEPEAPIEVSKGLTERVKGSLEVGPYNSKKGIEAILRVAADIGISEQQLTDGLLPQFEQLVAQSQSRNPNKPPEAHTAFAANTLFRSMEALPACRPLLDQLKIFMDSRKEYFGVQGSIEQDSRALVVTDFLRGARENKASSGAE